MPSRPSFFRLITPLVAAVATAMIACALAFKLVRPDLPAWLLITPSILASVLVLAWLMVVLRKRWVGPVRHLADVAEQLATGDWAARAEIAGAEDARALAGRMNFLAAAAQKQLSDLDHQRSDLQQLVDALPDPILLSDSLGRIMLINAPAARLLQLSPVQAIGKKVVSVVNDEQLLELFEALVSTETPAKPAPAAHGGAHAPGELRISRGGQRFSFQSFATRTKAGGALIVLRNVTAMAQTVQMKTDFVANASHELRTPLAAIKIAFETLRDVFEEDPKQTRLCVDIIDGHLNRLEEMLRDLLDLSRVENTDLKPVYSTVSADELFAQLHHSLNSMAEQKGVELAFEDDPDRQIEFQSDQRLLDLVLKNLVENSIKYTPSGGRVDIGIDWRTQNGENSPPQIVISVVDTGIGIPPAHRERVFERFYQVDPSRTGGGTRGTGLGLAIVKHAMHALGGTVELESEVGKGTTVRCVLPQSPVPVNQ